MILEKQKTNKNDNENEVKVKLVKQGRLISYRNDLAIEITYDNSGQYYNLARVINIRVDPGQNPG